MPHVVVEVWDPTNSTKVSDVTTSRQIRAGRFGLERNRALDCSVTVDLDHPNLSAFQKNRIVRVYEDGELLPPWRIENTRRTKRSEAGAVQRVVVVKGRTLRGDFDGSLIGPARGVDHKPVSRDRVVNFASLGLPTGSWTQSYDQTSQWSGTEFPWPERWTSGFSTWQWSRSSSATQPGGRCYARTPASGPDAFTLAEETNCVIVYSCDDSARLYCDGDYLGETEDSDVDAWPEIQNWMHSWREPIRLEAGTHVLAFECFNGSFGVGGTRAGLIFEVWSTSTAGLGDLLYVSSEDTLIWSDYPDTPPNFEVGRAFRMLLFESQDRDELLGYTTSFSDTHDSNGAPWPTLNDQVFRAGVDTLGTAMDRFGQMWGRFELDDEGLEVHGYVADTAPIDSAVSWTSGVDIQEFSIDDGDLPFNSVWVTTDSEMIPVDDDASIAEFGVKRSFGVSAPGASHAAALQVADHELAVKAWPVPSITFKAPSLDGKQPWKDFKPEQVVHIDGEDHVCAGIISTFGGDQSGRLLHAVEASTLQEERRYREERLVRSLEAGWSSAASSAPPLDRGFKSPSGRYGDKPIKEWSWNDFLADEFEEVDPETDPDDIDVWQPHPIDEPTRLWRWEINVTGPQEAYGTTKLILMTSDGIAGAPTAMFILELGMSDTHVDGRIFGAALLQRPQWVMPGLIADGGHTNGSVRIFGTEAR